MAPATYVEENGLVGHQWEERPLALRCPSVEECQGGKLGVSRWVEMHPHRGKGGLGME